MGGTAMKATVTITQGAMLPAEPSAVFRALMDAKQHAAFTGAAARIQPAVGGRFSVWDGYASGTTLELQPGRKIVQSWRASDWPIGQSSVVSMTLVKASTGTKLLFRQTGVPAEFAADVAQGWKEYYWTPLKAYFAARR